MEEFLKEGDKVRITVVFHGRENQHKNLGEEILKRVQERLSVIAEPDGRITSMGNRMSMMMKRKLVTKSSKDGVH